MQDTRLCRGWHRRGDIGGHMQNGTDCSTRTRNATTRTTDLSIGQRGEVEMPSYAAGRQVCGVWFSAL